jgi:hypothetical protein
MFQIWAKLSRGFSLLLEIEFSLLNLADRRLETAL